MATAENSLVVPFRRVLIVAPHPDDAELGCGASVVRWLREGSDVKIVNLAVRGGEPWNDAEALDAVAVLSMPSFPGVSAVDFAGLRHRNLEDQREKVLMVLEGERDQWKPEAVLIPAENDLHQDHQTARREALRVFKTCTVLGYENGWANTHFQPQLFHPVTYDDVDRKIRAVQTYSTQRGKRYCSPEVIRGLAAVRGAAVAVGFAEAFEVERIVVP